MVTRLLIAVVLLAATVAEGQVVFRRLNTTLSTYAFEDGKVIDLARNLTATNLGITFASGVNGNAGVGGGTQWATNSVVTTGTSDFSVAYWLKTSTTQICVIVSQRSMDGDQYAGWEAEVNVTPGKASFLYRLGGWDYRATSTRNVCDGAWHFIFVYVQRTGLIRQYIDGQLDGTVDISSKSGVSQTLLKHSLFATWTSVTWTNGVGFFSGTADMVTIMTGATKPFYNRRPAQ